MKTIIGETTVPDEVAGNACPFPPSWPHKVLQAAVKMRVAYLKAGRAGGPPAEALEALGDALVEAVTAELGEVLVPSNAGPYEAQGRMVDPFETPVSERTRSAMDEMPSHEHLPWPCEIASGRWDEPETFEALGARVFGK